jgi:hypothetical protein
MTLRGGHLEDRLLQQATIARQLYIIVVSGARDLRKRLLDHYHRYFARASTHYVLVCPGGL